MRKIAAFAALTVALMLPAMAPAKPAPKLDRAITTYQHQLHKKLGSSCTHTTKWRRGFSAVCEHGRVTSLARKDERIWERPHRAWDPAPGRGLSVRQFFLRPKVPKHGTYRTANTYQGCGDSRAHFLAGVTKGLAFHAYQFKVNTGFAANIDWRDAAYTSEGLVPFVVSDPTGGRFGWEAAAAGQDIMGLRNAYCSSWSEGGDLSGDNANNEARLAIKWAGSTSNRASLLPNCYIGDANTPPDEFGVHDGVNEIVSGVWHATNIPGSDPALTCRDSALAVTQLDVNSAGYTSEADISVNLAYNAFCYRFPNQGTEGCASTSYLLAHPQIVPMVVLVKHEMVHAVGLDHTCVAANPEDDDPSCSDKALMDSEPNWFNSWPMEIGSGEQGYIRLLEYTNP